jgi:hypothetical protein
MILDVQSLALVVELRELFGVDEEIPHPDGFFLWDNEQALATVVPFLDWRTKGKR